MEDPMPIGRHAAVPLSEITIRASRSSGPGGQHANVTESRIEASLEIASSRAFSDEQKRRIIARLGPRAVAVERLQRRLAAALAVQRPRRATRPTEGAKRRRLDAKRRRSERKRARRPPGSED
jgi:ribosome-associated protein